MHYSLLYNERRLEHCCVLLLSTTVKIQTRSSVWIRSAYSNSKTILNLVQPFAFRTAIFHRIYVHALLFSLTYRAAAAAQKAKQYYRLRR